MQHRPRGAVLVMCGHVSGPEPFTLIRYFPGECRHRGPSAKARVMQHNNKLNQIFYRCTSKKLHLLKWSAQSSGLNLTAVLWSYLMRDVHTTPLSVLLS